MNKQTIYKTAAGKSSIRHHYEDYLKLLRTEFERAYVETRFGKTHTLVIGPPSGKPVFIFQGGNCINPMTLSWFTSLFEEYRIYAPDTLGHPGYSAETRINASDESFALWASDLLSHFKIEQAAFIGPSYGAGIILRIVAFRPELIACSVLLSPSGIKLGSTVKMIRQILLPLLMFKLNSSGRQLDNITNAMSNGSMKEVDKQVIGSIFKHVKLEQEMPKLTTKAELSSYFAPTLVVAGQQDVFFPAKKVITAAEAIISNLASVEYDMGHFPSESQLVDINHRIKQFLKQHY
ncbi:alpha/beta fold hydrolase [Paenibacillus lentus]|uniref:alpha/beta fold hydrolase n=1 Tax=Paenibacillus lentus TaxID=1338368 RepID=UPI00365EC5F3